MIQALHTFDYELYFGARSGTPLKCMVEPMGLILDCFKSKNLQGIIFVDSLYLLKLQKLPATQAQRDYELIVRQLKEAVECGFSLGLHLHPHWLDATYLEKSNLWNFPHYNRYTLQSLDSELRERVIGDSVQCLEEISGQRPRVFRAGGWCIEPFDEIKPLLQKYGVKNDSSVVPGLKFPGLLQPFDFSRVKPRYQIWNFDIRPSVEAPSGDMIEIPVSTYKIPFLKRAQNILNRKAIDFFGDGQNMLSSQTSKTKRLINKAFHGGIGVLSLETERTIKEGNALVSRLGKTDALLVSVTHPKGLQKAESYLKMLNESWVSQVPCFSTKDLE